MEKRGGGGLRYQGGTVRDFPLYIKEDGRTKEILHLLGLFGGEGISEGGVSQMKLGGS